jgi:flagellar basal body rod protein FlgG
LEVVGGHLPHNENNKIAYTRSGEFNIARDDENNILRLVSINGYTLYDDIIFPSNMVKCYLNKNTLYAVLPDEQEVEVGKINIYEIDNTIMTRYKNNIFITENNFNSIITNDSRIIAGFLELSNANTLQTLMRMYTILCNLRNYNNNFLPRSKY